MNKFINSKKLEMPDYCSLYWAVRWVAFNEPAVPEGYELLIYTDRSLYEAVDFSCGMSTCEQFVKTYDGEEFFEAAKAIQSYLLSGDIIAKGNKYKGRSDWNEDLEEGVLPFLRYAENCGNENIPPDFWKLSLSNTICWEASDAESRECDVAYDNIKLPTRDINRLFKIPSDHKLPAAQGRKPKYDWEAFYRQIVLIANTPDGLPDIQADLERGMAQWCIDNNWPSEPQESHIRSKISPIYQSIKKAKN